MEWLLVGFHNIVDAWRIMTRGDYEAWLLSIEFPVTAAIHGGGGENFAVYDDEDELIDSFSFRVISNDERNLLLRLFGTDSIGCFPNFLHEEVLCGTCGVVFDEMLGSVCVYCRAGEGATH